MPDEKFKILLVDDHPLVREWLASLINQQHDLVVCGEAGSAQEALGYLDAESPDLAIVDLSLKESSGLELIKTMRSTHPAVAVIVLSMHDEKHYAERAIRAGARGYVMKRETTKKIITAIHQVRGGKLGVSDEVAALFAERFVDNRPRSGTPVAAPSDMLTDFIRLLLGLKRAVRGAKKARKPNLRRIRPAEYFLSDSGHWRLHNPEEYLSESGVWRLAS